MEILAKLLKLTTRTKTKKLKKLKKDVEEGRNMKKKTLDVNK